MKAFPFVCVLFCSAPAWGADFLGLREPDWGKPPFVLSSSPIDAAPAQLQQEPKLPVPSVRERVGYQLGRKLLIGTLAGLNSEVLFGNMRPFGKDGKNGEEDQDGGIDTALFLYAPTFILLDEIVQTYNLDALSMFYLGSLYGIFLEGIIVGSTARLKWASSICRAVRQGSLARAGSTAGSSSKHLSRAFSCFSRRR